MRETIQPVLEDTNWVITQNIEQDVFDIFTINVNAETCIIENEEIQSAVSVADPISFIFVSNLQFTPSLGVSKLDRIRKIVLVKSKDEFKSLLEENNIRDVKHEGSSKREQNNTRTDTHKYSGVVTLNQQSYNIEAYCMIFHNNEKYFVVGMAEPTVSLQSSFKRIDEEIASGYNPSEMTRRLIEVLIS